MFCDLVGSTAMSVRLGPEDTREVIRGYLRWMKTLIAFAWSAKSAGGIG